MVYPDPGKSQQNWGQQGPADLDRDPGTIFKAVSWCFGSLGACNYASTHGFLLVDPKKIQRHITTRWCPLTWLSLTGLHANL